MKTSDQDNRCDGRGKREERKKERAVDKKEREEEEMKK